MTASILARVRGNVVVGVTSRRLRFPLLGLYLAVLATALLVAGCGKSEPEPSPSAAPPATDETTQASESPASPPEEQPAAEPAPAEPAPPPKAALLEDLPEEKTPRPTSVIDWKEADYYRAKQDRDPRLVDAVAFLGEQGTGDVKTAKLLEDLLTTVETPESDPVAEPEVETPKPKPSGSEGEYSEEMYPEESYSEPSMSEEEYTGSEEYNSEQNESRPNRPAVAASPDVELLKPGYVSLIGAIVRALGVNGTEPARKTIEQVLAGKIQTGNDRVATSAALQALADGHSAEDEAILLKALTQSETLRPEGQGEVTAEQLRETTFDLVLRSAGPTMRMELAKYLFSPNPSVDLRERLVAFIMASHPYNLTPQTAIYQRTQTGPQVRHDFEVFFTTYSSDALARLLGVSTPPAAEHDTGLGLGIAQAESGQAEKPWVAFGGAGAAGNSSEQAMQDPALMGEESVSSEPSMEEYSGSEQYGEGSGAPGVQKPRDLGNWASGSGRKPDAESVQAFDQVIQTDADLPQYVAGQLWSPKFSASVAAALDNIETLEAGTQLVNLATTIPTDAARAGLFKTLQSHWEEGPQGILAAAELPAEGTVDPAFLALVKTVPRKMPERTPPGARQPARAGDDASDRNKTQNDWFWSSQTLLRYLCDGFLKAAEAKPLDEAGMSEAKADLSFKIQDDANVVAGYRIDWQKQYGDRLPGAAVDPLVVHYFRIQDKGVYSRTVGRYRRAVDGSDVHELDNGAWIDSYRAGSDASRKRSVDVLITRLPENTNPRSTEEEPLEIEILAIEFNDPSSK